MRRIQSYSQRYLAGEDPEALLVAADRQVTRLRALITAPPGSVIYDATHAQDAEEIARLRALLREAVLDRQAEMGDVCPSPCDHADCRWLREARKALEGRDG